MKDITNQILAVIFPFSSEYVRAHKTAISVYMTCLPIVSLLDDASFIKFLICSPSEYLFDGFSFSICPTASTPNWVSAAADSARARRSVSPSPADCSTVATSCCSTRSAAPSTNPPSANCITVSLRHTHKRPCFSSPTEQLSASYATR